MVKTAPRAWNRWVRFWYFLDIVREVCRSQECPDLILLDIHMPVMDGFEFLEEVLKAADLRNAAFKIVLLSSSTHFRNLARAKKYPITDFIQKPLTLDKLSKLL